jgi:hypothetical protein
LKLPNLANLPMLPHAALCCTRPWRAKASNPLGQLGPATLAERKRPMSFQERSMTNIYIHTNNDMHIKVTKYSVYSVCMCISIYIYVCVIHVSIKRSWNFRPISLLASKTVLVGLLATYQKLNW